MFTKRDNSMWEILLVGMLFCFTSFLFAIPCSAQKAPKGTAVIAVDDGLGMTGGDCHTASVGFWLNLGWL